MNNLFNSQRGVRGLVGLLIGIIILSILGMLLFNYDIGLNRRNINMAQAKRDVISVVVLTQHVRKRQLRNVMEHQARSWLRYSITKAPTPGATLVQTSDVWALHQALDKQQKRINLAVQLPRRGYLNIEGRKPDHMWQNITMLFCLTVLLLLLLLLCYWVIQYISTPLAPLTLAVERFAKNIKAPAISEQGSDEMRTVIRAFNSMQNNIRALVDSRTQMLAAISHDLRTPITRLKLRAEMIEDDKLQNKTLADLNDMEQMISSILAFARQQDSDESEQNFDLNLLLDSICDDMQDMGKTVEYKTLQVRLTFFGKMLGLKRAFTNIIENAVKYGTQCEVKLVLEADNILIHIQDQGPGIPEDKLEQVFTPFYRVNTARTSTLPGSGLGLAVAKEVINAQGGDIALSNTKEGLRVTICLPKKIQVG
jgi:signal transduction histidine kinase